MDHAQYHAVEDAFIAGFREAPDKAGFLALARIPLELPGGEGPGLKLLEVVLEDSVEVGRASPGFASRELVYHPLPGKLVTSRTRLAFRYVSSERLEELSLAELLALSGVEVEDGGHHRRHPDGDTPHPPVAARRAPPSPARGEGDSGVRRG
jgi:hypothetical protein